MMAIDKRAAIRFAACAALAGTCILGGAARPARACLSVASWWADLSGASEMPTLTNTGTGRATYAFDLEHPRATVTLDLNGVQDVTSVRLVVAKAFGKYEEKAGLDLYSDKDGPLPSPFSKVLTDDDIKKRHLAGLPDMASLALAVSNGCSYIEVCTKEHPAGAMRGVIAMHKTVIYSDSPGDRFHDPALHHAAAGDEATGGSGPASASGAPAGEAAPVSAGEAAQAPAGGRPASNGQTGANAGKP